MKTLSVLAVIFVAFLVSACDRPPPVLEVGKWSGVMIPEEDPSTRLRVYYRVGYEGEQLTLLVGLSDSLSVHASGVRLTQDSLYFELDSPMEQSVSRCGLGLQENGSYEGPCTDDSGRSTRFTMRPPDPFGGQEA